MLQVEDIKTVEQAKALAFDCIQQIEMQQNNLRVLQARITELGKTFIAGGRVYDATNGVNIDVGASSSMYEVFTFSWAGSTTGKVGYALCSAIGGSWQYVDVIKSGAYSGTVTFTGNNINIKPYNGDGTQYLVLRTLQLT